MYRCSKYKVEEYTDLLSGEIKRGIVSLHFALHYSVILFLCIHFKNIDPNKKDFPKVGGLYHNLTCFSA